MNLSEVKTIDLIEELKTRKVIEKGASGLWKEFDLTRRYSNHDRHIEADLVLVVRDLKEISGKDISREEKPIERLWRRFKPLVGDLSEFDKVCEEKGLTREDLKVILTSIELSEMGKSMVADGKGF